MKYGSHGQWVSPGQIGVVTPKPQQGDAERQRNYSLENASWWLYHHWWSLLSPIESSCSKTQREVRSNLLFARQCQSPPCKVDTAKVTKARMDEYSPSSLLSRLSSVPFSLQLFKGEKIEGTRARSKSISSTSLTKRLKTLPKVALFL